MTYSPPGSSKVEAIHLQSFPIYTKKKVLKTTWLVIFGKEACQMILEVAVIGLLTALLAAAVHRLAKTLEVDTFIHRELNNPQCSCMRGLYYSVCLSVSHCVTQQIVDLKDSSLPKIWHFL